MYLVENSKVAKVGSFQFLYLRLIKMSSTLFLLALFPVLVVNVVNGFGFPRLDDVQYPRQCSRNESFDPARFRCFVCPAGSKPATAQNGVNGCDCPEDAVIERRDTGFYIDEDSQIACRKCPSGMTATRDHSACMKCNGNGCECDDDEIRVERAEDGGVLSQIRCVACVNGTRPSKYRDRCIIDDNDAKSDFDLAVDHKDADEMISYGEKSLSSSLFKTKLAVSLALCENRRSAAACQTLGNLCALALFDADKNRACANIRELARRDNALRPKIYFEDRGLNSIAITTKYALNRGKNEDKGDFKNDRLNLTAVRWSLDGRFLGLNNVSGVELQMCNASYADLDAALDFGNRYRRKCRVPVKSLFNNANSPVFFDLYVPYKGNKLYAVPILVRNLGRNAIDDDPDDWSFVTRLFLVDNVAGMDAKPRQLRYLSKMEIHVELVDAHKEPNKAGQIYPPRIAVEYATVSEDEDEESVQVEFSVSYRVDMKEEKKKIEIAVGVMSVFGVLWAAIETWSWSRRSGKLAIDPLTLLKLVVVAAGCLANVFLAVIFFASLYWFIFFKQQDFLYVFLPDEDQEAEIKHYVFAIFALKILDVAHLLFTQANVDIFLLDWERPKPTSASSAVSVWRTYLVANEWNELQSRRKTHAALQIVAVVFVLRICGVENVASADGRSDFNESEEGASYVCRLALAVLVYAAIAIFQALFWCGVYVLLVEDKLQQCTDVCSLANVSVFVMANENFGYYVHGKSAHGVADTDMATLIEHLQREADDFCGHRGLQAGSDEQTFFMTLPAKLRNYYDKIVDGHNVQNYSKMNKFLTRFLEHALKDLDYDVREKLFLEKVLDVEFGGEESTAEKAIFYSDGGGHSFDAVLLYGHEFALTVFDIAVFLFVDAFAEDFLLAGIVTYLTAETVKIIRDFAGRRNLARKTLIDKRFLI